MPVFSIIIPVYKVEKYIKQCIESVINQTYTDFEAIFVDDCGGDNSIHIVEEYAKTDSRIKILYNEKNRGVSASRNYALENCNGTYMLCLDPDDWLELNSLEILYKEILEHDADAIWFDGNKYYQDSKTIDEKSVVGCVRGYLNITPNNITELSNYTCFKVFKMDYIKKYDIKWPVGISLGEDSEFYFKYFSVYTKIYIIENRLYNYRIHNNSAVTNFHKGNVNLYDLFEIISNLKDFYIEARLYEKYKISLLRLLKQRIETARTTPNNYQQALLDSKKILNELNYPDNFKEFDNNLLPVVSIVVPVYNVENYLEKCIKSIQRQTYRNLEIICIEDCSTDKSSIILDEFQKKDLRIKIIHNSKNLGLSTSRNIGIDASTGEYLFFVDSDDWIEPNMIETVITKFKETNLKTIWFKSYVWWENEQRREPFWEYNYMNQPDGYFSVDNTNFYSLTQYAWKVAYKRTLFYDSDLRFPEGILFEDMVFYTKLYTKYPDTYMIDNMLYTYRRRDASIISNCTKDYNLAKNLYYATEMIYNYLQETNLIEMYKDEFIKFVNSNMNMFINYPDVHNKIAPQIGKLLEKIVKEK